MKVEAQPEIKDDDDMFGGSAPISVGSPAAVSLPRYSSDFPIFRLCLFKQYAENIDMKT